MIPFFFFWGQGPISLSSLVAAVVPPPLPLSDSRNRLKVPPTKSSTTSNRSPVAGFMGSTKSAENKKFSNNTSSYLTTSK